MKSYLGEIAEKRGNFIGNNLRGMIVTVVHERQTALMSCGEHECKFSRTCRIGFNTDTEYL